MTTLATSLARHYLMKDTLLGRSSDYPDTLTPELLYPVDRTDGRAALQLGEALPFRGVDLWTAWEMSWLNSAGRPVVGVLSLAVPAESPALIESKSLKLYLNSYAMSRFNSTDEVADQLRTDLGQCAQSPVRVQLRLDNGTAGISELPGVCIDQENVSCESYELDATLLQSGGEIISETLHSHVLRSLCPVTGQPDTGSVMLRYRGPRIDRGALLAYIVSFRRHSDFHELCVERIFMDIQARCGAEELTVYARYNRRGGIDINPFRSNVESEAPDLRLWRQ
ncbi:MAG: NADPH-dependent 7-cyano-7-deazaguanine reductase QueF [Woeseia sp.]